MQEPVPAVEHIVAVVLEPAAEERKGWLRQGLLYLAAQVDIGVPAAHKDYTAAVVQVEPAAELHYSDYLHNFAKKLTNCQCQSVSFLHGVYFCHGVYFLRSSSNILGNVGFCPSLGFNFAQ